MTGRWSKVPDRGFVEAPGTRADQGVRRGRGRPRWARGGGQPGPRWKEGSRAWVRDTASWREGMRLEIWLSVCVLSLLPRALSYGLASHVTLVLVVLYILVS